MNKHINDAKPPGWALKLIRTFLRHEYVEEVEGDMEERFRDDLEIYSSRKARLIFAWQTIRLMRSALLKKPGRHIRLNQYGMFKNHLKISTRYLAKNKRFTFINVLGLAIGLASFLLINEYIRFEKSYDNFFTDADQLYRVSYLRLDNGEIKVKDAYSSYSVGEALNDELPEVLRHTVTKGLRPTVLKYGQKTFTENNAVSADSNFLHLFDYKVLKGNPRTMLSGPASVVLTESRASTIFGEEDPIGKVIDAITPYNFSYQVTGVIEDIPVNTHYRFDMLVSDKTLKDEDDYQNWSYNNYMVYLKLKKGAVAGELNGKATAIIEKYKEYHGNVRLDIHPVKDIYLHSDFSYEPQPLGSKQSVDFLMIISVFILVIAWVNYINLSTARSVERAREVGMRKVLGAVRKQLVAQFLLETLLVNFLGALIALSIAELFLPSFNQLVEKQIIGHVWNHPPFLIRLTIFWLLGSIASGFYPALILSGFHPIAILKGKFKTSGSGATLRKGLVIVQFAASLILIATTFIIYQQVNYMQGRDLGISIDKVISVQVPAFNSNTDQAIDTYHKRIKSFKASLNTHSAIIGLGATSNLPGGISDDINVWNTTYQIAGHSEKQRGATFVQMNDNGFLKAMDLQLRAGRNFNTESASDSNAVLVNEAFLKRSDIYDYTQAVNSKLLLGGNQFNIVGVVNDFNRTSLKQGIEPTMYLPRSHVRNLVIKLNDANYLAGIEHLKQKWSSFFPDLPFEPVFIDDRFLALYKQDRQFGNIFSVFSILAISIAILGLYGLASFYSMQRSKEVGVRKVLGASKLQISYLFCKNFFQLIGLSAIIGLPIVYFSMDRWLNNYAYRIDFPWWLLVISLLIILLFAFFAIGYQTQKVASLDPAKTLKYE